MCWLVFLMGLFLPISRTTDGLRTCDNLPSGAVTRYGTEELRDPVAGKVLYLPDGKTLVSAGWTLRIWDITTRKLTAEYPIPGGYASYLSCSLKGDQLYLACTKFLAINTADGKVVAVVEQPEERWASTAVSPNGKMLVAGGFKGEILFWELPSGKPIPFKGKHEYTEDSPLKQKDFLPVGSLSFHPTLPLLATAGRDQTARVWDLNTKAEVHRFTDRTGNKVMFTPDGKHAVTNDAFKNRDGIWASAKLLFWNIATGKRDREIEATLGYDAVWSKDGKRLVTGIGCCSVGVYDIEVGRLVFRSPELGTSMASVSVAQDGNTFASVSHGLDVRDIHNGRSLLQDAGHIGMIHDIKRSHDQTRIATASADTTIRLWNIKTGREMQKLQAKAAIHTLAFASFEDVLASGGPDGVTFWDLKKGTVLRTIPFEHSVQWIEFTPDSKSLLVGCTDLGIHVLDADSGKLIRTIGGDPGRTFGLNCFLQSVDGKFVIRPLGSGSGKDVGLVMEDSLTGKELHRFAADGEQIVNGALSPDGTHFAHGGKEVVLYEVENKKKVATITVAWYGAMRFSPDSKHLYLGRDCYDVKTRKKLFTLPVEVEQLEFSADGKLAFTTHRARCSVLAWDLEDFKAFRKQ